VCDGKLSQIAIEVARGSATEIGGPYPKPPFLSLQVPLLKMLTPAKLSRVANLVRFNRVNLPPIGTSHLLQDMMQHPKCTSFYIHKSPPHLQNGLLYPTMYDQLHSRLYLHIIHLSWFALPWIITLPQRIHHLKTYQRTTQHPAPRKTTMHKRSASTNGDHHQRSTLLPRNHLHFSQMQPRFHAFTQTRKLITLPALQIIKQSTSVRRLTINMSAHTANPFYARVNPDTKLRRSPINIVSAHPTHGSSQV